MFRVNLPLIAVLSVAVIATTCQAQSFGDGERCQIIEGNGIRVDQCDAKQFLACKDGRCQCPDLANQIHTYRMEPIPGRGKRSPGKKGGGFKKVAAGAVAGAATYHVVSQASKGSGFGFSTTPKPPKYQKVYSCYSRVGGQCALNYNNYEIVNGGSTTTTTTTSTVEPASANSTSEATPADNSTTTPAPTTTSPAPQAAAQVSTLTDLSKIPPCVQYAKCKTASPPSTGNNGTSAASQGFTHKVDFDPRIGVCECEPGYERNNKDLCVKQLRSGGGKTVTGAGFAVILATLVFNKMFV